MGSIAEELIGQLAGGPLQKLCQQIGIDEEAASGVVNAAIPTLLSALGRNAAQPEGANSLTTALNDHDGSILNDLAGFIGGGGNPDDGAGILGHIFGAKQGNVEKGLSKKSGLDIQQIGKILVTVAPIVMGMLGRRQRQDSLDANGVAEVLKGERTQTDNVLGGFAKILDMDGDGDITDDLLDFGGKLLGGLFKK